MSNFYNRKNNNKLHPMYIVDRLFLTQLTKNKEIEDLFEENHLEKDIRDIK